jgi:hypothetical protein
MHDRVRLVGPEVVSFKFCPWCGSQLFGEVDEHRGHFIDANEAMGDALVAIGLALGLPRPGVDVRWGAKEILQRIHSGRS